MGGWEPGSAAPCGYWRLLVSAVRLLTVVVVYVEYGSASRFAFFSIPGEVDGWPSLRQEMESSYGVRCDRAALERDRLIGENYGAQSAR